MRELSRTLVLCAALAFLAASAQGTPLGLQYGDEIESIQWDAFDGVDSYGGEYTLGSPSSIHTDGRITSVLLSNASSIPQTNVDFTFDVDLTFHFANFTDPPTNRYLFLNAHFGASASVNPDVTITQDGNTILTGDFSSDFVLAGILDLVNLNNTPSLVSIAYITVTGGDSALVAALGGMSATAKLRLDASVFDFDPPLGNLAGDENVLNSDFRMSFSGTLAPIIPAPFVPEPGTMALVGVGLLGLLAVGRRRRL